MSVSLSSADVELSVSEPGSFAAKADSLTTPLVSSDAARSPSLVTPASEPKDVATVLAGGKEALIAELSQEAYAEWVSGIMQEGKARSHWVWPCRELGEILAKDNPARWEMLNAGIKVGGWPAICEIHPKWFVSTGVNKGEEHICCRRYPTEASFVVGDEENSVPFYFRACYNIAACLGTIMNLMWCCCGYVLPNCFCAWRWPCCQAPYCCCGRSYWDFSEIEPKIKTGDIFLFCGTNSTRVGGQSHWSHIGVALRDDDGDIGPTGLLYVFEANFGRPGWNHCDLRLLEEKIETYKGGATDCGWRPLLAGPEKKAALTKAILHHCGAKYDHNLQHMFMAAVDCCSCFDVGTTDHKREMFCSQAVAQVLQDAEVLPGPPDGPPACEYLPRDFGIMPGCNTESGLANKIVGKLHMMKRHNYTKWTGLDFR